MSSGRIDRVSPGVGPGGGRSPPTSDLRALDVGEVRSGTAGPHPHPKLDDRMLVSFVLSQARPGATLTIRPELTSTSRVSIGQEAWLQPISGCIRNGPKNWRRCLTHEGLPPPAAPLRPPASGGSRPRDGSSGGAASHPTHSHVARGFANKGSGRKSPLKKTKDLEAAALHRRL